MKHSHGRSSFFMDIFSCPEQLNRRPCLSLAWSVTTNNQSLHNTTEWPQRLVTFETFVQSDEKTWHDQKKVDKDKYKENDKVKNIQRTPSKSNPRDLWPLRHLFRVMRRHDMTKKNYKDKYIREHPKGAIIGTCDIWDTDYNSDKWEPEFITIFVTWQLIVTLDSMHNSCDVFLSFFCGILILSILIFCGLVSAPILLHNHF